MMPSSDRASISFSRAVDQKMIAHLAELSGQSISGMCGHCLSEYLQENYHRLRDFYASTHHLMGNEQQQEAA